MKKLIYDISLILRGVGVLNRLSPHNLSAKILRSICDAALPFANLSLSAMIIDAIANREAIKEIIVLILLTLGINLVLLLVSKLMDNINYVKWNEFYLRYNMSIGEKAMSLSYSKIEDPKTHIQMKNIDDAMRISNYGLIKLHSRIPLLAENAFKVIFSLGLTISVIVQKVDNPKSGLQQFANSIYADIALILMIILSAASCIFANTKIATESYSLLGVLSRLNRVYDYYLNHYLSSHKAGKDIRLYHQDELILDEIDKFSKKSGDLIKNLNTITFRNNCLIYLFTFILTFYTYVYVTLKSMAGAFAIGSILKYSGGILQFSTAFSGMMDALSQLRANSRYLEDYFRFIDLPSDDHKNNQRLNKIKKNDCTIAFENVSFQYLGSDIYALKEITFTLRTGEKIAVVGMNGSGKTTMIKLLCRLYEPTKGKITLNGINIQDYEYDEYISLLGVVFQDFKLLSFMLGKNVAAQENYEEEKVIDVLKKAGMSARISTLPNGIHTYLYKNFAEDGVEISGGEAQKIALARALYKDASIIVLDEPTAALDPVAEFEIYSTFNKIIAGKTAIYISHRLSSCRFCDRILVFHHGELVQQGEHERLLLETTGIYSQLWNEQAKYYNNETK